MLYESEYLAHYGIPGQQWGTRRFQNEDGSLTAEGRSRYGAMYGKDTYYAPKGKGSLKRYAFGNNRLGSSNFLGYIHKGGQQGRTATVGGIYEKRAKKASEEGNMKKAEKNKKKYEAQRQAWEDRQMYIDNSSTGKGIAQKLLLLPAQKSYIESRARGAGRLRSVLEATTLPGKIAKMHAQKKKYGKAIIWSDM